MKRLDLLDYGRFFAAIAVMLYHYTLNGISNGKITSLSVEPELIGFTKYGFLGVEFFFMISGYVIFFSAVSRTASQFLVSRALRLFPAFWFGVLFTAFFALLWGTGEMVVSWDQILANLTMVAPLFNYEFVDGVYWTLLYEITFYGAVFVLLLFGFQKKLELCVLLWPIFLLIALLTHKTWLPLLGGFYYYFAAGALLAVARNKPQLITYILLAITLGLCLYVAMAHGTSLAKEQGISYSPIVISAIIITFFLVFAFMNAAGPRLVLPHARILGALTYPAYLLHAHFGYMALNKFANDGNKVFVYPLLVGIVILLAWLLHKLVEVKMGNFWKRFFVNTVGKAADIGETVIQKLWAAGHRLILRVS